MRVHESSLRVIIYNVGLHQTMHNDMILTLLTASQILCVDMSDRVFCFSKMYTHAINVHIYVFPCYVQEGQPRYICIAMFMCFTYVDI